MWFGRKRRLLEIRRTWGESIARERRLDAIAASHAERCAALGTRALDDRTWADLDLDDVFVALDRTTSTLGQHALYHRLRTAPVGDHLDEFETLVERLRGDDAARERAQLALSRLQDPHGYDIWWLGAPDALERRPWYSLFPILTAVTVTLAVAALFWSTAVVALVVMLAVNMAVRYATDARTIAIARSFRQLAPLIVTAESLRILDDSAHPSLTCPLRRDVPSLARLKLISRWVNGNPFMLSFNSNGLALALADLVEIVYEYLNIAFLLDATGVHVGLKDLAAHRHALLRVVAATGEVDAAISVASYREGAAAWTRPQFGAPGSSAELDQVVHPLLQDAVPNSIGLQSGRGVLVTGSNMSGKSTFLRTVGVNAILAQTIDTCLARTYAAPVFVVRSCIGRSDDLVGGKSYCLAEVEALLALVEASDTTDCCLFLLDELFRGTNAVERIAAGEAVLSELLLDRPGHDKRHVALAATHDGELVDLLSDRFDAWHFGDSLGRDGLAFDHRLRQGPATSRNAIALLRLSGAPESLVSRATKSADRLDRERGVTVARR
jgi:MutS domain V